MYALKANIKIYKITYKIHEHTIENCVNNDLITTFLLTQK